MLPGMLNSTPYVASGTEIINAMAANPGSFVSAHPNNYTGGILTWTAAQTFSNVATTRNVSEQVFRDGNTNDSLFTAGSNATSSDMSVTSVLAWQTSRTTTPPLDFKVNGLAATEVASAHYGSATSDDTTYRQSYRLYKAFASLIPGVTTTSADFQSGGATSRTNNKGGFVFLPGGWDVASTGTGLSGSGSLAVPSGQVVLLIGIANEDAIVNVFGFSANANLSFLLNYAVRWYDALQVAVIGNPTSSTQNLSYSINIDACHSPIPVFFKSVGGE